MRKFFALLAVLALSGCAATEPAPTITPVDLKYCAVADAAGFNDDSLNRTVYAAMQQLKVQTGAAVSAIEVNEKLSAKDAFEKLADSKCNAIVASGSSLVNSAIAASRSHSEIRYYSVSDATAIGIATANYTSLTFNIFQAAFVAGYLSAVTSSDSAVPSRINVNNKLKTSQSFKIEKAFALGVERFNSQSDKKISVVLSGVHSGEETIFAIAGYSKLIGVIAQSSATAPVKIVGFGRDWYADARNKELRSSILTSVVRNNVIGKVADAVSNQSGSAHYDLSNDGVGLADAHDLNWPIGFAREMSQMIKDFQDGKVKVD